MTPGHLSFFSDEEMFHFDVTSISTCLLLISLKSSILISGLRPSTLLMILLELKSNHLFEISARTRIEYIRN